MIKEFKELKEIDNPTREELKKLVETKTAFEISEVYDVGLYTVYNWCRDYNVENPKVKSRFKGLMDVHKKICDEHLAGASRKELAKKYCYDIRHIHRILHNGNAVREPKKNVMPPRATVVNELRQMSKAQIATKYGVTQTAIYYWIDKYNIQKEEYDIKDIAEDYLNGDTVAELCYKHKLNGTTLYALLNYHGLTSKKKAMRDELAKTVLDEYSTGKTLKAIATDHNLSGNMVAYILRKAKAPRVRYSRPTKEELKKILETNSVKQASKYFNVTDTTVRNWLKHYGMYSKYQRKGD